MKSTLGIEILQPDHAKIKSMAEEKRTDLRLNQLEKDLDHLKNMYDQYFAGQIRFFPEREHKAFEESFRSLGSAELSTTGHRFRHRNLQSRFVSLKGLWEKTCRQIEEGTYHRDRFKLKITEEPDSKEPLSGTKASSEQILNAKQTEAVKSLYKKMLEKVGTKAKVPNEEKFMGLMKDQIKRFKEKNPNDSFSLKLGKDKAGQLKVQIQKNKK